jgi:hypothetical protein
MTAKIGDGSPDAVAELAKAPQRGEYLECASMLALSIKNLEQPIHEQFSKAAANCRTPKKPDGFWEPFSHAGGD